MLGPLSMLVIGMLLGNMRLKEIMGNKRAYFIVFLRLVALPLIATVILGLSHISGLHPEEEHTAHHSYVGKLGSSGNRYAVCTAL